MSPRDSDRPGQLPCLPGTPTVPDSRRVSPGVRPRLRPSRTASVSPRDSDLLGQPPCLGLCVSQDASNVLISQNCLRNLQSLCCLLICRSCQDLWATRRRCRSRQFLARCHAGELLNFINGCSGASSISLHLLRVGSGCEPISRVARLFARPAGCEI